ncbi:hypothetical protein NT6N_14700 [Oceaniferula spumae]|uniref:DUF4034 domain-containing protein n=1 Tax=Oceaniferula spumae TaxID=2979115 RepID=A0AAT9FKA2_9BACT
MSKKAWGRILLTHFAAVAVGAIVASYSSEEDSQSAGVDRPATRMNRAAPRTNIGAQELLAAYRDNEYNIEAIQRRNNAQQRTSDGPQGKTPEELAAMVTDFKSHMDEVIARLNSDVHSRPAPLYSWHTTSLVMTKWLANDPDAALTWLGSTDCEALWNDIYSLPLKGRYSDDPLGYYKLISDGWKKRNQGFAFKGLAQYCAMSKPEHIPTMLAAISPDEKKRFLSIATRTARPEDWRMWLDTLKDLGISESWRYDTAKFAALSLMQFQSKEQVGISDQVLEAVSGTELEALFNKQYTLSKSKWDEQVRSSQLHQLGKEDPIAAYTEWVKIKQASGMTEAQAQAWTLGQATWGREFITPHLQRVLLGEATVGEAFQEASKNISNAPPELAAAVTEKWYYDALIVAPEDTVRYALANNAEPVLRTAFDQLADSHDRSSHQKRTLLQQTMGTELWASHPNVKTKLKEQLKIYYSDNPQAATSWAQSLPTAEQQQFARQYLSELPTK